MPRPDYIFKGRRVILAPEYLPCIDYYALLAAYPEAVVDATMKFDKRHKTMHRCDIADTHGVISLTVPIEKPVSMSGARWCDIRISRHNHWWNQHLTTLKSAYGRTPFFEYYLDDFLPFYSEQWVGKSITEFNNGLDRIIRKLLGIDTTVIYKTEPDLNDLSTELVSDDYRKTKLYTTNTVEYYQVRKQKLGFIPSMSIVDLLFNMGPESPLILGMMV